MTKQTALKYFLSTWLLLISVLVTGADILFVSDRDWNSEIYIMDEAGNNPRIAQKRITAHPGHPINSRSSWPEVHKLKVEF